LLGGFLTDNASWRWIFYINVPLGAVALVATSTALPSTARRISHRIDWLGAGLLAAGTSAIILLATWGGTQFAWLSAPIIALAAGGLVVLGTFFVVERRVAEPIIPPRLFRSPVFNVASAVGFVIGFAMFGAIVFLPLFLQLVDGASATSSGLNLLPLMVGLLTASIGSGQVISRMGRYKIFPITGTALAAIAMLLLSTLNPQTPRLLISLYMVVLGAGLGMVMQVLVLAVQNAAERRDLGVATSSATFLRSIGSSFGVAIFGAIFSSQLAANLRLHLPASALGGNLNPNSLQGNPAALQKLPPAIHSGLVTAVADSLHVVFLTAVPILIVAFVITLFLREIPLGSRAKPSVAAAEGMGMDEVAEVVLATADQTDGRATPPPAHRSALRAVTEPTVAGTRPSNDAGVGH
jgi:predicted MFS family arabinose efflux permease